MARGTWWQVIGDWIERVAVKGDGAVPSGIPHEPVHHVQSCHSSNCSRTARLTIWRVTGDDAVPSGIPHEPVHHVQHAIHQAAVGPLD